MIHTESLLHTLSPYANRWGGPRYRTTEFLKFVNKHLYEFQIENLFRHEEINTSLACEAFLSVNHTPYYMRSLRINSVNSTMYEIEDELGFKAIFPEKTEILMHFPDADGLGKFVYSPIENIKAGDERVINFELVEELKNDTLHHHKKFSEDFLKINCKSEYDLQIVLCDSVTSMMIVKKIDNDLIVERQDIFNKTKNIQEIYLVKILNIKKLNEKSISLIPTFSSFSHILKKDKKNSDRSNNRYYKSLKKELPRKILEKMRKSVFGMKKSKLEFMMELIHEKNRD